jgi:hypothetical protein
MKSWGKNYVAKRVSSLILVIKNITHAKAQRRKALPRFQGFLCAFAPLRENISHIT